MPSPISLLPPVIIGRGKAIHEHMGGEVSGNVWVAWTLCGREGAATEADQPVTCKQCLSYRKGN